LRVFACVCFIIGLIGVAMVLDPIEEVNEIQEKSNETPKNM